MIRPPNSGSARGDRFAKPFRDADAPAIDYGRVAYEAHGAIYGPWEDIARDYREAFDRAAAAIISAFLRSL